MRLYLYLALMAALAGCASTPHVPRNSGTYRVGQPYQVAGNWYYPKEQPDYNEVGLASWYGPGFHGHLTADGEVYDQQSLTAAHATLPLPVNVRVTNLDNGRSIVLRVNDRGPFHAGRIIDVSARAAELLGFKQAGTARVRVEYLSRADGQPYTMTASSKPQPNTTTTLRPTVSAPVMASMVPIPNPPAPIVTAQDVPQSDPNPPQLRAPITSSTASSAPAQADSSPSDAVGEAGVAAGDLPTVADLAGSNTPSPRESNVADLTPPSVSDASQPSSSGQMYVQVGAFSDAHMAMQTYNQVLGFGKASVSPTTVNGRTLYRVRLGPVADADEASRITTKLKVHGHDGAKIVLQ